MMNRYVGLDVESTAYTILRTCGPRRVVIAQKSDGWLEQLAVALREAGVQVEIAGELETQAQRAKLAAAGTVVRIHVRDEDFAWAKSLAPGTSAFLIEACEGGVGAVGGMGGVGGEGERTRRWWEERIFASGLVRHARYLVGSPYSGLHSEHPHGAFVLERPKVDGDGGFLTESTDAGDSLFARYMEASEWVRAGDIILDVASREGAGSCVLAFNSETGGVVGCDGGEVEDALARYGSELVHFIGAEDGKKGLETSTAQLPGGSVDFVVMVRGEGGGELLGHEELMRVLTPGGRAVVFSDWPREKWAEHSELLVEHEGAKNGDGEFRLVVLMRTPLGAGKEGYREQMFPDTSHVPGYNLYNFERDYDNPYLFRAMVCIGPRMSDVGQLKAMAEKVLEGCREGSADEGAAVCVLAYEALSQVRRVGADGARELTEGAIARIDAFEKRADKTAHALRWVISNRYVKGRLLLASGRVDEAQRALRACAESDVMPFSPLLATKTVDAWRLVGAIASAKGDVEEARACWLAGMKEAKRVTSGDWTNVWGNPQEPAPYGLHELSLVMDAASGCASWMNASTRLGAVPGMAWTLAQRQTFGDTRQYIKDLTRGRAWLSAKLEEAQGERARVVDEFDGLRVFHEKQMHAFEQEIKGLQGMIDSLKKQIKSLEEARAFDLTQRESFQSTLEERKKQVEWQQAQMDEMKKKAQLDTAEFERAKKWLEGQVESWKSECEAREKQIAEMREYQGELVKAGTWHEEQLKSWKKECDVREKQIAEMREYQKELITGSAWHEEQTKVWERECREREKTNVALMAQVEAMRSELDALAVQREGLAKEHQRVVREREECARERVELQRILEEVKSERVTMVQRAQELEKSLEGAQGMLDRERARVSALKSRSLWERVKNRELEE